MSRQAHSAAVICKTLVSYIAEQLEIEPDQVSVTQPLADFGLSSREAVMLAGELEEMLQRELSPTLVWDYPSIEELTRFLSGGEAGPADSDIMVDAARRPGSMQEPIAIIGMACRFPGGADTPEAFWELLRRGRDGIVEVPAERWDIDAFYDPDPQAPGKMYTRRGGFLPEVAEFDAEFFDISPREALRMDPQQRLLLEVAWEALEDAGQVGDRLARSATGVFIGITSDEYLQRQLRAHGEDCLDDPYFGIGSASSLASGRLSYQFDLRGPSVALDTACSSSLVALHVACQSLRAEECRMAVVGGVNAVVIPDTMVNACKMGMLSADGRCKTFDARADGFALGEGGGVVVLKRLADAETDHDNILAIIRGSAVNEDGRSNSITAPNGLAQQNVIRQALARAGIPPHLVGYVEAHGSGTALGDPIEMGSLQAVLTQERTHPLTVGAVKTNIGHLVAAAGLAGLMKTVLALRHASIPAHLNLQEPNPSIAWDEARIRVPTREIPWEPVEGRRIAGVSSFGWSGTNAHAILEEAPPRAPSGRSRSRQLLLLSAKSQTALDSATEHLAKHLLQHPEDHLADVAYTLQVGRGCFDHRRIVVCRDRIEATSALETREPGLTRDHVSSQSGRPVTMMFPGLGDQHVGMAADLYEEESAFRQALDHCCELLQPHLGLDLRDLLFSGESELPSHDAPQTLDLRQMLGRAPEFTRSGQLDRTVLAQPAVFAIEYALAKLWMSWGVRPDAMIGYSLGEYVAACLAGVFSLEDGVRLVAERASLIDTLQIGAMLAVSLPEEEVTPLLDERLSLSAINGPTMCVVGGPCEAIAALEQRFHTEGVACRKLQTTHAFHTDMMRPIAATFLELIESVALAPPRIPYASNVTGTWVTPEQVTDPSHWVAHLLQPVQFAAGVETLWQLQGNILLEVGVGQTLGSLALLHPARADVDDPVVLASMPAAYDRQPGIARLLRSLGELWLAGTAVDWSGFYAHEERARLSLPTYSFQRQQYWMAHVPEAQVRTAPRPVALPDPEQKNAIRNWFYVPTWERRPLPLTEHAGRQGRYWLFFVDDGGLGKSLAEQLGRRGEDVTAVVMGESFRRLGDALYSIDPASGEDYAALHKHLHMINKPPDRIVHLWNVTPTANDGSQLLSFHSLVYLAQALGSQPLTLPVRVWVVSNHMQDVLGDEQLHPQKATLLGPCKVMPKEYELVKCTSVDVVSPADRFLPLLLAELLADDGNDVVAYRGLSRWVRSFRPMRLEGEARGLARLRPQGVYLVTGGFGGLGAALAERLTSEVQAKLILVGRSSLPSRESWPVFVADRAADAEIRRRIEQVMSLETAGATVMPAAADVSDPLQMQAVVDEAHQRFGHINGVFHLAGVPGEGFIQSKTKEMADRVLAPKVEGTMILSRVLRDEPLDFMVLYSSTNAVFGGLGEVDYSAANAFLDAFAHYHSRQASVPTMSINWGAWQWDAWQGTRLAALPEVYERVQRLRRDHGLTFDEGERALWRVLGTGWPQVMVLTQDLETTAAQWESLVPDNLLEHVQAMRRDGRVYPRPNLRTPFVAPRNETECRIAEVWADALAVDKVGIHDHFFELGGNSLIGMMIISRLERQFDIKLPAAALYEGPTVGTLHDMMQIEQPRKPMPADHSVRGQKRKERQRERQSKRKAQSDRAHRVKGVES